MLQSEQACPVAPTPWMWHSIPGPLRTKDVKGGLSRAARIRLHRTLKPRQPRRRHLHLSNHERMSHRCGPRWFCDGVGFDGVVGRGLVRLKKLSRRGAGKASNGSRLKSSGCCCPRLPKSARHVWMLFRCATHKNATRPLPALRMVRDFPLVSWNVAQHALVVDLRWKSNFRSLSLNFGVLFSKKSTPSA